MMHNFALLWPWMYQTFGMLGAIPIILLALLLCLAWIITPISVWFLYRKGRDMEQVLIELRDRTASQSRQQQVDRLKRDKRRRRPSRRR
jgi:hypothetical protein